MEGTFRGGGHFSPGTCATLRKHPWDTASHAPHGVVLRDRGTGGRGRGLFGWSVLLGGASHLPARGAVGTRAEGGGAG